MPKPGHRTTYKYSDEFKATAVKLSHLPGVAIIDFYSRTRLHSLLGYQSPIEFEQACA